VRAGDGLAGLGCCSHVDGAANDPNWSNATNWGGTAPSSTGDSLTFPLLPPACNTNPPPNTPTCYLSFNNGQVTSASGLSITDDVGYFIDGSGITLGSGGITATASGSASVGGTFIQLPITLGSAQTWSLDGGTNGGGLAFGSGVTGTSDNLTLNFSNSPFLGVQGGDIEVGTVTASGPGEITLLGSGIGASLNGSDHHPINLSGGAGLSAAYGNSSTGPLAFVGGNLNLGRGSSPDATLAVMGGGVALSSTSTMSMFIDRPGTTPGTDYTQLTATGAVALASAHLQLNQGSNPDGSCPALNLGDVDTLITTSAGGVSGTFAGIPDGTVIPLSQPCTPPAGSTAPTVRINYTPTSVTATVVSSGLFPTNTSPPTISGTPQQGNTLTESHGSWNNNPTSYSYQWQQCDSSGGACASIAGATSQTYTLTAGDVGHTIRVQEVATNSTGSSSPATSVPTGVVNAPATTTTTTTSTTTATTTSTTPATTTSTTPPPVTATTQPATGITAISTVLNGLVGTGGAAVSWQFQFGLSTTYNKGTPVQQISAGELEADGSESQYAVSLPARGDKGKQHHLRAGFDGQDQPEWEAAGDVAYPARGRRLGAGSVEVHQPASVQRQVLDHHAGQGRQGQEARDGALHHRVVQGPGPQDQDDHEPDLRGLPGSAAACRAAPDRGEIHLSAAHRTARLDQKHHAGPQVARHRLSARSRCLTALSERSRPAPDGAAAAARGRQPCF